MEKEPLQQLIENMNRLTRENEELKRDTQEMVKQMFGLMQAVTEAANQLQHFEDTIYRLDVHQTAIAELSIEGRLVSKKSIEDRAIQIHEQIREKYLLDHPEVMAEAQEKKQAIAELEGMEK